jgi:mRNA-degrading endonuclease toxin of MazEF toxin-antitoxin module
MRRGEVWRVRIPFSSGHAQAGSRPALIVQNDALLASLPTVLIVPFPSTPGAAG